MKSFDGEYCKPIIETVFKDIELDLCVSIMNDKEQWPEVNAKEHLWIPAAPMRDGDYSSVDWSQIDPLDADLIKKMRDTEAVFCSMIDRYAHGRELSYTERKKQYFDHLRFWNDFLDKHHIDLLLLNHVPHQCYDYVLYDLCKLRNIPTLYVDRSVLMDAFFVESDWKEAGKAIGELYQTLCKKYDEGKAVDLSPDYQSYFDLYSQKDSKPWFMGKPRPSMGTNFFRRWWHIFVNLLLRKPGKALQALFSPSTWKRKLHQHSVIQFYEKHVREPDLAKSFVYVPLHMQPEATTSPMGGVFNDQDHMINLLASCLPKDVRICVKEHPYQSEVNRSIEFYKSLLNIPSVTFVSKNFPTLELTEKSAAVATVTGTAAFEALFRGKPVLMFGHRFFQYAPGIHRIHTEEDCKKAVEAIFQKEEIPSQHDLQIYLKAIEELATPYVGKPDSPHEKYSYAEKAVLMGKKISEVVKPILTKTS